MVPAGQAEGRRGAAVEVGGHQHQPVAQAAEVVAAAGHRQQAPHLGFQRGVAEDAGGQRAAQPFQRRQQAVALEGVAVGGLHREARQRGERGAPVRPPAGRMKTDGCTRSSLRALFSMNAAHNWRGVMPLASAAATKLPAETPT